MAPAREPKAISESDAVRSRLLEVEEVQKARDDAELAKTFKFFQERQ